MAQASPAVLADQSLAATLGVPVAHAAVLREFASLVTQHAAQGLGMEFGQPVSIGAGNLRRIGAREIESENWDLYHPIDVRWDIAGANYAPLLLLPRAELQTLLPAARGTADLPDMEALGTLLRELAEHLSAELEHGFQPPVGFSLPDAAAAPHDQDEDLLRLEHTVSVGSPGSDTELTVVHLIPAAALQAIAAHSGVDPSGESAGGEPDRATAELPATGVGDTAPTGGEASILEETMASSPSTAQSAGTSVHPVQFQPFDGDVQGQGATNLDLLMDVGLRVSVELGRADLTIKDILALGPGSVVELDKLAGEPVDILVNDRLIAKGEVVVVDENFGVRVTDIMSPQKRIGKLR